MCAEYADNGGAGVIAGKVRVVRFSQGRATFPWEGLMKKSGAPAPLFYLKELDALLVAPAWQVYALNLSVRSTLLFLLIISQKRDGQIIAEQRVPFRLTELKDKPYYLEIPPFAAVCEFTGWTRLACQDCLREIRGCGK